MQKLNTTLVYILSVVGFLCCCVGLGWIPSLFAYIIANKESKKYNSNPDQYSNGEGMKTAKIIALIVLIISALVGLYFIYLVIMLITNPEFACEFWTKWIEGMENNPSVTEEMLEPYRQYQENACNR